jgi:hypothetical protein
MKGCCGTTCFLTLGCGCILPILLALLVTALVVAAIICPGCVQITY